MSISDRIAAIKDRHDDYWWSAEAFHEAVAAWGAEGQVNDCGVFCNYETEVVAKCGRAVAHVGIYKVRDGVFVHCCRFTSTQEGFGFAPSIWTSAPHQTADQARQAGIVELLHRIAESPSGNGKSSAEELRQTRQQLRRHIEQPALF